MDNNIIIKKKNNNKAGNEGIFFRAYIKDRLNNLYKFLKCNGWSVKDISRDVIKKEKYLSVNLCEEISKISNDVNLTYFNILMYNLYHDFVFPSGCTVLLSAGDASLSGNNILLKNSDKSGRESFVGDEKKYFRCKEINVLRVIKNGKNTIVGVSDPGMVGIKMGINSRGIATASNCGRTKDFVLRKPDLTTTGNSRGLLMVKALECSDTVAEATEKVLSEILRNPISVPGILWFVDSMSGNIIEYSCKEFAVEKIKKGVSCRSNMFTLLKHLNYEGDLSSICRYTRANELLQANKGLITPQKMMEFSMDHINGPGQNSICRHGKSYPDKNLPEITRALGEGDTTVSSAIMEIDKNNPRKSKIFIALGKPCRSWKTKEGHIAIEVDNIRDINEGFTNGEKFKKFYEE